MKLLSILLLTSAMLLAENLYVVTTEPELDKFPLSLVEEVTVPLLDVETKEAELKLKNCSDKPAKIEAVRSGCTCLRLLVPVEDKTVGSKEELTLKIAVDGTKLKAGLEKKMLLVKVEGIDYPAVVHLNVDAKEAFILSSGRVIQLGVFIGAEQWSSAFTVKSLVDGAVVKPPKDSSRSHFNVTVTGEAPEFKVVLTPKELKPMKFKEPINLQIEGIKSCEKLEVDVIGEAIGWRLMLDKPMLANDTIKTKLCLRKSAQWMRRGMSSAAPVKLLPVDDSKIVDTVETWESVMKDVTCSVVEVKKTAVADGILIEVPVTRGEKTEELEIDVKFKEKTVDTIKVRVPKR